MFPQYVELAHLYLNIYTMYTILKGFTDAVAFNPDTMKSIQVQVKYFNSRDFQHRICMQVLVILMQRQMH